MKIQLINGTFTPSESIDLLTQLLQVKIKFIENKILKSHHEEDVKSKENKIIKLQNTISTLNEFARNSNLDLKIESEINLSH